LLTLIIRFYFLAMAARANGEYWKHAFWTANKGQPTGLASSEILDGSGVPAGPPSKSFYSSSFSHLSLSKKNASVSDLA
jgi:hypothetical protein